MTFSVRPEIDDIDRKILEALNENGHASFAELGELVGLKAPSVHARVKRLEHHGVIRGYRAVVEPAPLGFGLGAFVAVTQASGYHWEELERGFAGMPEVEECHSVTGDDSYLLKVRVGDPVELEALLRRINMVEGVARTRTVLILSTTFDRRRVR
jgi:Lrp/AsnC family leucine-responsive transcriptional regulator